VTTGEGIWNITGRTVPYAIADGYLVAQNMYDGIMYVFGKGKTSTTLTAPDIGIAKGTTVAIKGTVLDMSPAQLGKPCVSKDSMSTQMEYLHMQHPIDGLDHNIQMKGVPVVLTAMGSDGSIVEIGTTMTTAYGGSFGISWTPTKEDTYTIMASFAGDESYGSSMATTSLVVVPAPEPTTLPEQIIPPDYTMTIIGAAIAVIIAVAIVGVLVLRKH